MLLKKIDISSERNTKRVAEKLSEISKKGDIFSLNGELGCGKTSFARYFIQKACGKLKVPSPSYNIYFQYNGHKSKIFHLDAWRIEEENEFLNLGVLEFFNSSIFLIEWAEKVERVIPKKTLKIVFEIVGEKRQISLFGESIWKKRIASMFYENKLI